MDKIIIFSHESDIDGLGCVILAKLAFSEVNYILAPNVEKLELIFRNHLQSGKLESYHKIFVTDLALYDPSLTMVAESSLKDKVFVFDHHKMSIENNMNRYPFTKIVEEDGKGKRCATDLFFEYLSHHHDLIPTKSLEQFVELTKLEDTWEWKNAGDFGKLAHDLAILFNCIGREKYISKMLPILLTRQDNFSLDKADIAIIQQKKETYEKELQTILASSEYFLDENKNKFGIVYANYEYRNEIPEYIERIGNPQSIQYMIIVAMDKGEYGQKSYRSIDKSFDVNVIAMHHGGGGHPGAACVSITKEQKEKALSLNKKDGLQYLANSKYC